MKYVIVGGDELTTNNTKQYQRRVRQEPDHPVKNVETQYGGFHTMMKVAQVISSLFCYPISRFSRTGDGSGSHSQGHFPHHLHSSPSLPLSVSHFSFFQRIVDMYQGESKTEPSTYSGSCAFARNPAADVKTVAKAFSKVMDQLRYLFEVSLTYCFYYFILSIIEASPKNSRFLSLSLSVSSAGVPS